VGGDNDTLSHIEHFLNPCIDFHLIRMFIPGKEYRRGYIHDKYGGNRQSGISPSRKVDTIFLFTGETGEQYGYEDGWNADKSAFYYSGEGIEGDMEFTHGNKAIRDHVLTGKELYLFRRTRKGYVEFVGQMVCTECQTKSGRDYHGNERTVIVFTLTPIEQFALQDPTDEDLGERQAQESYSIEELRKAAYASAVPTADVRETRAQYYTRSKAVSDYVKARAAGTCEGCGKRAPFTTRAGNPYLEVHHIRRLSDAGPDDPAWVAALCPNCHRKAHHSHNANEYNVDLYRKIQEKEAGQSQ